MNEIGKYGVLKEKLQGICEENDLTFSIRNNGYPYTMTIKPLGGFEAQQTMMEGVEEPGETGYISPDASLVFAFRDGDLTYKISETWTISESLFNKLKNLFKKMHGLWMQYFFRDIHEHSPGAIPTRPADGPAADYAAEDDVEDDDAFSEFLADSEDAVEDSEALPEDLDGLEDFDGPDDTGDEE